VCDSFESDLGSLHFVVMTSHYKDSYMSLFSYLQVALLIYKSLCIYMSLQLVVMLVLECLHLEVMLVF